VGGHRAALRARAGGATLTAVRRVVNWGWILLTLVGCASKETTPETNAAGASKAEVDRASNDGEVKTKVSADDVGKPIVLDGWAVNRKGGAVLVTKDDTTVWILDLHSWPDGYYDGGDRGKRVRVTGILDEDHGLPVFVPKEGEPIQQGIPVPEGTDLDEASKRFVLRDAKW
jgi:hypothetical protein